MSVNKLRIILFSSFLIFATAPLASAQASEPAATSVEDVKQIQQALTDLSYNPGDINGLMTADTQEAIRQFQWFNDLPVTGIVDEQTKITLETQWRGGVENAQLGQTPLSAEREKPNSEFQQNRTDSYNENQNQTDTYNRNRADTAQNRTDSYNKDQKTTTDNTYNQGQTDHSKHHNQDAGKH